MILGIGVDMVAIERIGALLERHGGRALERLFTPGEAGYCRGRAQAAASFAARFAAKEAFFKALGTGWAEGVAWRDVEVIAAGSGAPSLRLSGAAAERARALGVRRHHLSLTHTAELAAAYVVLEG